MKGDLTRWNRAGLTRFRYVDGNAVTYFDELKAELREALPIWTSLRSYAEAPPGDETRLERNERLEQRNERRLSAYRAPPGDDLAVEIVRAFARACHVLSEHIDVYANEGYLVTATEWENVRRLVALLDYHPAPPSSASTHVALLVKAGKHGTVAASALQLKHTPETGGPPIVFETLEDVVVSAERNELRPRDHDRAQDPVSGPTLELDGALDGLEIGGVVIVENEATRELHGRRIAGVRTGAKTTTLALDRALDEGASILRGQAIVHLAPADALALHATAEGDVTTDELRLRERPSALKKDDIVVVHEALPHGPVAPRMYFAKVDDVTGRQLQLTPPVGPIQGSAAYVSKARTAKLERNAPQAFLVGDHRALLGSTIGYVSASLQVLKVMDVTYNSSAASTDPGLSLLTVEPLEPSEPAPLFATGLSVFLPPAAPLAEAVGDYRVDARLELGNSPQALPATVLTDSPRKASAGDLVAIAQGDELAWARLESVFVDSAAGEAALTVAAWQSRTAAPAFFLAEARVHAHFETRARLVGWSENTGELEGNTIELATQRLPDGLEVGGRLILEQQARDDPERFEDALLLTIENVIEGGNGSYARVVVDQTLPPRYPKHRSVLRGNVVLAGHGALKPERILGSGNAQETHQAFVLEVDEVSFVADPAQAAGVAAALELRVDGRRWTQVSSLADASATDAVFELQMTEDGHVRCLFGDGEHGRRLPTGTNNVRVSHRQGVGLRGNLAPESLTKLAKPHALVEGVRQPLPTSGGNDAETIGKLRESAPASVLTLDRAVSLSDYARLAAAQSTIWQARASARQDASARHAIVKVIVVPAGGTSLGPNVETLRDTLQSHALPGVEVQVLEYDPHPVAIQVLVGVDSKQYVHRVVATAVESALRSHLSLASRKLGQSLYRSEITRIVEETTGVAYSTVLLTSLARPPSPASNQQVVAAAEGEVIHVDAAKGDLEGELTVRVEEAVDL